PRGFSMVSGVSGMSGSGSLGGGGAMGDGKVGRSCGFTGSGSWARAAEIARARSAALVSVCFMSERGTDIIAKNSFEKHALLMESGSVSSSLHAIPRPITLDLSPVEVAARCVGLDSPVFFDSAQESEGAISIVAAE